MLSESAKWAALLNFPLFYQFSGGSTCTQTHACMQYYMHIYVWTQKHKFTSLFLAALLLFHKFLLLHFALCQRHLKCFHSRMCIATYLHMYVWLDVNTHIQIFMPVWLYALFLLILRLVDSFRLVGRKQLKLDMVGITGHESSRD